MRINVREKNNKCVAIKYGLNSTGTGRMITARTVGRPSVKYGTAVLRSCYTGIVNIV